jgi:hypothetical protein
LQDTLSVTFKDRLSQLKNADASMIVQKKSAISLLDSVHYLKAFQALLCDLDNNLSTDCLDAKQSLILADIKLKRLESYVGSGGAP